MSVSATLATAAFQLETHTHVMLVTASYLQWCIQAVKAVADAVRSHKVSTLVVDPVLVATSGDSLAGSEVAEALKTHLFPLATIITPNLPEASALLGNQRVSDLDTMKQVAEDACPVFLLVSPLLNSFAMYLVSGVRLIPRPETGKSVILFDKASIHRMDA